MSTATQNCVEDIVQVLRELPEPSHEEFMADIYRLQAEFARGAVDIAGRPVKLKRLGRS